MRMFLDCKESSSVTVDSATRVTAAQRESTIGVVAGGSQQVGRRHGKGPTRAHLAIVVSLLMAAVGVGCDSSDGDAEGAKDGGSTKDAAANGGGGKTGEGKGPSGTDDPGASTDGGASTDAGNGSEPQEPAAVADGTDGCEKGELADADGNCLAACEVVDCGDNSSCTTNVDFEVLCTCADGFSPDALGACVDPCDGFDCGSGTCANAGGAAVCTCVDNFAGDNCEGCGAGYKLVVDDVIKATTCELAIPATTNMIAWLDADADSNVTLVKGSNAVAAWVSPVGKAVSFVPPAVTNRPNYEDFQIGTAQSGVTFDGTDDLLTDSLTLGGSYSVFIVLNVARSKTDQTILSGVDGGNKLGFNLRTSGNGSTAYVQHAQGISPKGAPLAENVTLAGLALTERSLVEVHRVGLGLTLISGEATASTVIAAEPLPSLKFELGRRGSTSSLYLKGTVHEVIVVSPGAGTKSRAAYRDYLRAKWQLP